jgi:hypothetical protein
MKKEESGLRDRMNDVGFMKVEEPKKKEDKKDGPRKV